MEVTELGIAQSMALRKLRANAGYRYGKDLARKMDIPASTYSRYDSGRTLLIPGWVQALADELDCTLDELCGRAPDIQKRKARTAECEKLYDSLSEESQMTAIKFMKLLAQLDGKDI